MIANIVLSKNHNARAQNTISKIKRKKKYKEKNSLVIGVHVRRKDSVQYYIKRGIEVLRPSYYLEAMDLMRNHYNDRKVIFLMISDDIEWCHKVFMGKKLKDLFLVTKPMLQEEERYTVQ